MNDDKLCLTWPIKAEVKDFTGIHDLLSMFQHMQTTSETVQRFTSTQAGYGLENYDTSIQT